MTDSNRHKVSPRRAAQIAQQREPTSALQDIRSFREKFKTQRSTTPSESTWTEGHYNYEVESLWITLTELFIAYKEATEGMTEDLKRDLQLSAAQSLTAVGQ